MVIKWKIMGLLLGTFLLGYSFNILIENAAVEDAMAKTISRCDYTYISEGVFPGIGTNGNIKYDKNWKKVLNEGWRFRFKEKNVYIFEKCN